MNKYIAFALGFAFAYAFVAVALRAYAEETDRMYPIEDETWTLTSSQSHNGTGYARKDTTSRFSRRAPRKAPSSLTSTLPLGSQVETRTTWDGQASTTRHGRATTFVKTQEETALSGDTNSGPASHAESLGLTATMWTATQETTSQTTSKSSVGGATKPQTAGSNSSKPSGATTRQGAAWRKTVATFYGTGDQKPRRGQTNYDDGKLRRTSDGTPYKSDGMFCATYLVPLGTTIEVKRGKVVLRLVVRDRPAKVNGHKIDIPTKTWDRFGAKRSIGKLPVEWRRVNP